MKNNQNRIRTWSPAKVKCGATLASANGLCGCDGYLGPISTSFCPLPSVSFGSSDSGSICSGGRNNQRTTSFCSALRLLQPVWERQKKSLDMCQTVMQLHLWVSSRQTDTHLSAPRCSTALWWLTAGGRAWLPSVRLSHSQLHYCRTWPQPWLMDGLKINPGWMNSRYSV